MQSSISLFYFTSSETVDECLYIKAARNRTISFIDSIDLLIQSFSDLVKWWPLKIVYTDCHTCMQANTNVTKHEFFLSYKQHVFARPSSRQNIQTRVRVTEQYDY